MSFETGAPPPPDPPPLPEHALVVPVLPDTVLPPVVQSRPARGYEATSVVVPAPTPGVTTYRLRGTEVTRVE